MCGGGGGGAVAAWIVVNKAMHKHSLVLYVQRTGQIEDEMEDARTTLLFDI